MSKSREQLMDLVKQIDIEDMCVLDIGVQNKPARMLTTGHPLEYHTTDLDPAWEADFQNDINLSPKKNIKLYGKAPEFDYYDVIFCLEVLEHCYDPVEAVENMAKYLKPGGDIYISTPFINPHHDEWDYLRYTNEWYEKVLPMSGIKILSIVERKATVGLESLKEFYATEGLKYSKIRQAKGPYTYPIGYFIHGRKQ